jgi:hypothetical protein
VASPNRQNSELDRNYPLQVGKNSSPQVKMSDQRVGSWEIEISVNFYFHSRSSCNQKTYSNEQYFDFGIQALWSADCNHYTSVEGVFPTDNGKQTVAGIDVTSWIGPPNTWRWNGWSYLV